VFGSRTSSKRDSGTILSVSSKNKWCGACKGSGRVHSSPMKHADVNCIFCTSCSSCHGSGFVHEVTETVDGGTPTRSSHGRKCVARSEMALFGESDGFVCVAQRLFDVHGHGAGAQLADDTPAPVSVLRAVSELPRLHHHSHPGHTLACGACLACFVSVSFVVSADGYAADG
jgi:hypothetical protein